MEEKVSYRKKRRQRPRNREGNSQARDLEIKWYIVERERRREVGGSGRVQRTKEDERRVRRDARREVELTKGSRLESDRFSSPLRKSIPNLVYPSDEIPAQEKGKARKVQHRELELNLERQNPLTNDSPHPTLPTTSPTPHSSH